MTSRPLFTSVAELVVTSWPMFQVGWASACAGVTSASSARVRPRNGPPLAVSTSRRTSARRPAAQALGQRRVLGVDARPAGPGAAARVTERAAGDQRLLVGEGHRAPGLQRGQGGPQPLRAGDRVEDDVGIERRPVRRSRTGRRRSAAAARPAGQASAIRFSSSSARRLAGDADELDPQRGRLRGQQRRDRCRRRRSRATANRSRIAGDDVDRLGADRSGRAEDRRRGAPNSPGHCGPSRPGSARMQAIQ